MGKNYYKNQKVNIEENQLMEDEQVTTDQRDSVSADADISEYPKNAVIAGCIAVNLRKDAKPTAEVVKTLREGTPVIVLGTYYGSDYSIVEDKYDKSITGYIPSKFLKV